MHELLFHAHTGQYWPQGTRKSGWYACLTHHVNVLPLSVVQSRTLFSSMHNCPYASYDIQQLTEACSYTQIAYKYLISADSSLPVSGIRLLFS